MKKLFLAAFCFVAFFLAKAQQTVSFSEYFDYSTGYCPGDPQYDNWISFRGSLDTTSEKFLKITMKGTYDMVGKSCSDKYVVRQIADALYNGYDLTIQCGSDYWYVGTGCSDYNCGNYSDYVELTTNQYGTCNCGTGYTIRPGMTSPNWGGINTETCQWYYQNANQTMIAEVLQIYKTNNLAVTEFIKPDECINKQDLKVKVMNLGFAAVNDYYIGYSINGVNQTPIYINSTIQSEEEYIATFSSGYSFTPGSSYDFVVWTYDPNGVTDDNTTNDLIKFSYTHTGSPNIPTASDVKRCGQGTSVLSASAGSSDSIIWYDASTGGNLLKLGNNYTTPFLTSSKTFYAESNAFKSSISVLSTTFHNYTMLSYDQSQFNGNMFDIKANKLIKINGIKVQALFGNTNPYYRVYIREGTFVGNESDQTKWTILFSDYISANGDNMNTIPVEFIPEPGKTYGIYVTTDPTSGEDIWANYGNTSYSNSDLTMSGGKYLYGLFASRGLYSNYMVDAEIMYSTSCASSARKAVKVTVNPKPYGSELAKGSTFEGRYDLGLIVQPDVAAINKVLNYELTNPALYSNAGYNTTWKVNTVELFSEYGVPVNTSLYSFTNPSSTSNGLLSFKADNSILDSNIFIKINYMDLGPYLCDTTVTRVVHIAPTPVPDFAFNSVICDGDDIVFENKSVIHSGDMDFKWYFGDGDSSDSREPNHKYNTFGTYNVKLVAKSFPWGIENEVTMVVNVNEIPNAKFKVVNACEGGQESFINQTTIGSGAITYDWNFGDNTANSTATNPTHGYSNPGAYKVQLKASSNGCTSTAVRNAYLFAKPVADFTLPSTSVCARTQFDILNNSTLSQGEMGSKWDYGDGEISTQYTGKHIFSTANTYKIKLLMVSEFGCMDSISKNMVIKPTPTVDFTVDRLCSLTPSQFVNTSSEFSGITSVYNWIFSDGVTFSTKNVTKSWSIIGDKEVTLKSNLSNGCYASITKQVNVLIQPKADFTIEDICSNEPAVFINKSYAPQGKIQYSWDFGDVSGLNTEMNPVHVYNVPLTTTFMVSLVTKIPGGCDDSLKKILTVTEIPKCNFTFSNYFLSGNRGYKFNPANTGYSKYEWYFGEGGVSQQPSPIYQYLYNGPFKVKLIAENAAGCKCESTQTINVSISGLNTVNSENVQVYPNPANDQLSVKVSNELIGSTCIIYNSIGQIIENKLITSDLTFINTENFSNGFYIVKLVKNTQEINFKITVNH